MTRQEIIDELWKEFDPELGFFKRTNSGLILNPRAMMLWGILLQEV